MNWHEHELMQDERQLFRDVAATREAEIARLREERDRYRDTLERLSRLGNGDSPGNSEGNVIAQHALKERIDRDRERD